MPRGKEAKRQLATRKKRERDLVPEVLRVIEDAVYSSHKVPGSEVERRLKTMADEGRIKLADVPSLRTIQRTMKDLRVTDRSGIWHLGDSSPEDGPLVQDVLANVLIWTGGRKRSFSKAEAQRVLRVKVVAPDTDPIKVWRLARQYLLYESRGKDTAPLDMYIAFAPWRSRTHSEHYLNASKQGWVDVTQYTLEEAAHDFAKTHRMHEVGEPVPLADQPLPKSLLEWSPDEVRDRAEAELEKSLDLWQDSKRKGEAEEPDFKTHIEREVRNLDEESEDKRP